MPCVTIFKLYIVNPSHNKLFITNTAIYLRCSKTIISRLINHTCALSTGKRRERHTNAHMAHACRPCHTFVLPIYDAHSRSNRDNHLALCRLWGVGGAQGSTTHRVDTRFPRPVSCAPPPTVPSPRSDQRSPDSR